MPPDSPTHHGAPFPSADDTRDGLRLLRRYHEATLQYHERRAEVRFIIDSATGHIILPADPGFAGEVGGRDAVVHLPDEVHRHLQLAIECQPIARPESEESVDRWHAYHAAGAGGGGGGGARPHARTWLRCRIDGGKAPHSPPPGEVYSGESLTRPNPLRSAEFRLVKLANADRAALARLARSRSSLDIADPLCVGIDPFGLDLRARFGILRIEFDLEAASPEQAEACLNAMLQRARS